MASVRQSVGALLGASLLYLWVWWEAALQIPQSLLVAAFSVYSISNYVIVHPRAPLQRKFAACLVLTFADIVCTSFVLWTPQSSDLYFFVGIYVSIFILLYRLHPNEKCWELQSPMIRGMIYLSTGFFMGVGVAQGLEAALQTSPHWLGLLHAAVVVVGKQVLTTLVYTADEVLSGERPLQAVQWGEVLFNVKAGLAILATLGTVTALAPATHPEFTWCAYVSNVIYLSWGALDAVAHHKYYSKLLV